ncbi:glucans biosynthesis glucosyltransferase MdoH [Herbaspirillum sp. YR522]|uniref:glucans biosynthesis glucosyltransferase MdoH n=1 Tax=Herbaspirillum sp. YR522 TaxID=1144342 RepID=UPI00026F6D7E|nr:glucans biosynthesis glucosyltransferase MdoH [Herbaspirillum sp. YR522]EJN09361.1 membrane glycosyltransferase [Herbaspirillum sp. YR522]
MELHITPQLRQTSAASQALEDYLDRLPLSPGQRLELIERVGEQGSGDPVADLHRVLAAAGQGDSSLSDPSTSDSAARASVAARLQLLFAGAASASHQAPPIGQERGHPHIEVGPPLARRSMVPRPWGDLNPLARWVDEENRRLERRPRRWRRHKTHAAAAEPVLADEPHYVEDHLGNSDAPDPKGYWQRSGNVRRITLLVLMVLQTSMATYFMSDVLPYHGTKPLEMLVLGLFALLFLWVSAGFWTAMTGFLVLMRGDDEYLISHEKSGSREISPQARTAIVMPICNEDVARVLAGLRATYESLERTGQLQHFDFFILSDSYEADICAAEVQAWTTLCRETGGFGRIFYRHRRRRVKRKSGNLDDFCRRWGSNYRYMVVLDADSVMTGECLTKLTRLMEEHPGAGIIQTAPRAAGRDTLYARIQQFSTRVYGPLFTAGLHYWQLGESHFWGHNAIIRLAPFMKHCALAPLPGRGNLSGPIMSHDFVEASLMRRAGWSVWIAYDLDGSYEEMPPNLLDELSRDRRWCQGNLMNFRLFLARGMHVVHRAVFVTGVMAYVSAPLWALFLVLSTLLLAAHTLIDPQYFVEPRQMFPIWPEWHPEKALALVSATATILFLPKVLAVLLFAVKGARGFGGALALTASMIVELLFSMVLAPVRMLFHTRFVLGAFLGWNAGWKSPPRADNETGWGEAVRRHGMHSVVGVAWGALVYWLNPSFIWWLLPIAGSLAISIPVSVLSSRVGFGRAFRGMGFFKIPEETDPPFELRETIRHHQATPALPGFIEAVVDPAVNALVCATAHAHPQVPQLTLHLRDKLVRRALREGPDALDEKQKMSLLDEPGLLSQLHQAVWSGAPEVHPQWRAALGAAPGAAALAA